MQWYAALVTALLLSLMGVSMHSCSEARAAYYAAMNQCISKGGSWVPGTGENYNASCINPN